MARKSRTISILTEDSILMPAEISFPNMGIGKPRIDVGIGKPRIGPKGKIHIGILDDAVKETALPKFWPATPATSWAKTEVNVDELTKSLSGLLKSMDGMLSSLPAFIGEFRLDSMTLDVEISAEGSVSLLGTGGKLSGKGGLSLTLKRPETASGGKP